MGIKLNEAVGVPKGIVNLVFNGSYKNGLPNGSWTVNKSATQGGKSLSESFSLNFTFFAVLLVLKF